MNFGLGGRSSRWRRQPANSSASLASGRQSSPDDNWDDLDLSSSEYARRRKELMQLINDLRSMGAQTLISLPQIVVIGGQSAGKSSLVEAVSGINVPRDSGTCTRCPMECTMSSTGTTWSCTIKLRFDYEPSGNSAAQSREIAFGPIITNKDDVEIWLRRAQGAILNPGLPPEAFHKKSIQDLKSLTPTNQLKFSRNVVSIFIEDPSATDLSFVDLPGLIQNEEKEVIELVQQLTESYISRPNTIILTTIPMSDDIQNQKSVTLAKDVDPLGERTIGILTKPDKLGEGEVGAKKNWLDVIEGNAHKLKLGYYCVRLPDDAQRAQKLSKTELQRIAAEYFDNTSPWKDVADRGRFGIPAFVRDISTLLVNHINRVLPQLKQDIERLLGDCLKELDTLPKLLELDPQIEVLARVNAFCADLKSVVSGTSSDKSLAQRNRKLYETFAQEIRGTSPDFRPFDDPKQYERIRALEPEEEAAVHANCGLSEAPREMVYDAEPSPADPMYTIPIMGVYDVRKTIADSTGWELPNNIPYEAKTRLIRQSTELWSRPAEKCLTSINDVLDDVIQNLVKIHFGQFRILQHLISELIGPDVEEHKSVTLAAINETLELENSPNYTQNLNDYRDLREKWLAKYRNARRNPTEYEIGYSHRYFSPAQPTSGGYGSQTVEPVSPVKQALRYLAQAGYVGLSEDDLTRLSPPDQRFDDELVVMADVRAYFTIACKRIIDHIPLKIEHSLHHALANKLSVSLLQRLLADTASMGNSTDRMKELVSEDPAVEAKRARLQATRARLQEMKRKLANATA